MSKKDDTRYFLITYSNGDVFYFSINSTGEIYCKEFRKAYQKEKNELMPSAFSIDFTERNFTLKDQLGNTIYSLDDYQKSTNTIDEEAYIIRFYIDEDIRQQLLTSNVIKYNENVSNVAGLLSEPTEDKTYTRKRIK